MFDLPSNAVASSTDYIGVLFTDLGPFIWLAIGVPLGFYVIKKTADFLAPPPPDVPQDFLDELDEKR